MPALNGEDTWEKSALTSLNVGEEFHTIGWLALFFIAEASCLARTLLAKDFGLLLEMVGSFDFDGSFAVSCAAETVAVAALVVDCIGGVMSLDGAGWSS